MILVYDILNDKESPKISRNIFKICKKYLVHIQKSVFEGEISEADLMILKKSIEKEIKKECDSVIIFKSRNKRWLDKDIMGIEQDDRFMI